MERRPDGTTDGQPGPYRYSRVRDEGHVRIVTLARPEVMNALHSEANHELEAIWNEFDASDDLWVGIVTGMGERAFCAGNDLKVQAAGKRGPLPQTGFGGLASRFDMSKPVIAAVNGVAMGGGFEIALACDLIIASEDAVFALPEPRVGLVPSIGLHRLPRAIPQKQAAGIIMTGRRVSAQEGKELGFVNEVVGRGEALAAAQRWAQMILECSPMAIRACKEAMYRGLEKASVEESVKTVYPAREANLRSADYIEGPKAFAEKRKPHWLNR